MSEISGTNGLKKGKRPGKARLVHLKVVTVILSAAAFVATLVGVAVANPGTAAQTATQQVAAELPVTAPATGVQGARSIRRQAIPAVPQMPAIRPMGRTRGS